MNCFKRKALAIAGAILAALALAGCVSDGGTKPDAAAGPTVAEVQIAQANARSLEATARIREAEADKALADRLDAGGAGAAYALRQLKGLGLGAHQQQAQQQQAQPPSALGTLWQAALQIADVALRGYGIKANRDVNLAQSNNSRDVSLASYQAFASMGHEIGVAGTAGYPYVQAPGAVTTSIGGNGVIGSGSFSAPVTTTTTTTTNRNCAGGTAAPGGGAGDTGTAGTGGSATGGSC